LNQSGKLLEIGSGGGFLKEIYPQFTTSDIMPLACCDMLLSAEKMDFANEELGGIVMLNVLHHIPNPRAFFSEAVRCLKPGGRIVMVEPANTFFSRIIYQNFHHEPFNTEAKIWEIESSGPLSGANGANPWIIFIRDRQQFEIEFPNLAITNIKYHTPFRYLLSGGVSMRALVPTALFGLLAKLEKLINPFLPYLGMFMTIEIEKK
jgi:SAM-dependent methyltransferase